MGEEVRMSDYRGCGVGGGGGGGDGRVSEWEAGLPSLDDLTPLSQGLIPLELASAFSISPEPRRSVMDVNRASEDTLSVIRGRLQTLLSSNDFRSSNEGRIRDGLVAQDEEVDLVGEGSDSRKLRRINSGPEEADSALRTENGNDDSSARTLKRPRLVWTPQLHKRFIDVVGHLGVENAVPKTIMQMMNVEGLTRENVASHLQKYRLYLKRNRGFLGEGAPSSDPFFASTPVPQSRESGGSVHGGGNGHLQMPVPMPYPPQMMHMPMIGMTQGGGNGHMEMRVGNSSAPGSYHGFGLNPYNMVQQRDWPGNNFGSVSSYQHVTPNNR